MVTQAAVWLIDPKEVEPTFPDDPIVAHKDVKFHYVCSYFEGVALLPFVDEARLRASLAEVYSDLTPEEGEQQPHTLSGVSSLLYPKPVLSPRPAQ